MKTSTKVAIGYSIAMVMIIFSSIWYASRNGCNGHPGFYEFTVITHSGLVIKDTFEMDGLPKEALCRAVHYPIGLKPMLVNPIVGVDIDNWYQILQRCSTEQTEYQFRTKVEYYFATPRFLKK